MTEQVSDSPIQAMRAGTLLIAPDTIVPADWPCYPDPVASGWSRVTTRFTDRQLDRELAAAGWTFFFRAGAVKKSSFGWNPDRNIKAALVALAAEARRLDWNCLQIDSVMAGSLLGVPCVRICAHVRHIQKGIAFSGHSTRVAEVLRSAA